MLGLDTHGLVRLGLRLYKFRHLPTPFDLKHVLPSNDTLLNRASHRIQVSKQRAHRQKSLNATYGKDQI